MPITKDEIAASVKMFYKANNQSPRLKDVPNLPFSKQRAVALFGTWNKMLLYSNVPLNRHPPVIVKCAKCGKKYKKQIKEIKKSIRDFCSSACNASFYTAGRKHTMETKAKISASLKAHRIFGC